VLRPGYLGGGRIRLQWERRAREREEGNGRNPRPPSHERQGTRPGPIEPQVDEAASASFRGRLCCTQETTGRLLCPRRPLLGTIVQPSSSTVGVDGLCSTLGDCGGCGAGPFPLDRGARGISLRGPRAGPPRRGPLGICPPREGARCSPEACLQLPLSTARDLGAGALSRASRGRMGIFCSLEGPFAAASAAAGFASSTGVSATLLALAASSAAAFSAASLAAASRARFSSFALSSASFFSLRRLSSTSRSRAAVSIGRAAPNGLALESVVVAAAGVVSAASETVRLVSCNFGLPEG
jgi:hypothetical protein